MEEGAKEEEVKGVAAERWMHLWARIACRVAVGSASMNMFLPTNSSLRAAAAAGKGGVGGGGRQAGRNERWRGRWSESVREGRRERACERVVRSKRSSSSSICT